MTQPTDPWHLAAVAAAALAVDPEGLGGITLRDNHGPVRDAFLNLLATHLDRPVRRLPGSIDPAALSGGVDLVATLRSGERAETTDLLRRNRDSLVLVPMAERMTAGLGARLAAAIDGGAAPPLVLLDEGVEPDEGPPHSVSDRLAVSLTLHGVPLGEIAGAAYPPETIAKARDGLGAVDERNAPNVLTQLAAAMGIPSLRAPLQALRLARCLAALDGEPAIAERHISLATALCLAPRARVMPSSEQPEEDSPPPPPDDQQDDQQRPSNDDGEMADRVLEAVAAALPDLVLSGGRKRGGASLSGSGDRKRSASHGRPIQSRPGKPEGKRLDVFGTLLTAAPWQPLRRKAAPDRAGVIVRPDDFRIKQYDRPSESVMIFLVDASGSQAAARMAEAKGAVELMLSEAYRRREKVALIAFRGTEADLILPPTRSLLQAKRRLSILPGGGPTPLARALVSGRELALQLRRRGATPYLVLLTDGRGNIGLDGQPGRAQAAEDSKQAARSLAAEGITSVLIDTANRPQADAKDLARVMDARYLPLPRADAHGISRIVRASVAA